MRGSESSIGTLDSPARGKPWRICRSALPFHRDPSRPQLRGGHDAKRCPTKLGTYLFDLEAQGPGSSREALRRLHYPFVKLQLRFNLNYNPHAPKSAPGPVPVTAATPRPALRFLRLPFVY